MDNNPSNSTINSLNKDDSSSPYSFSDIFLKSNLPPGDITTFLWGIVNNIIGRATSATNFIILFPRPDIKGLGYIPLLFFIFPKDKAIQENMSIYSSQRPIVNIKTRHSEFINYNVTANPKTISVSNAVLSQVYDKNIIDVLKNTGFRNSVAEFELNFIKDSFKERFNSGIYYTLYSRSTGFHETVIISSLSMRNTFYLDEIQISMTIKIVKTFNFSTYKG